jgi:alkylated DNA repair dioxygenase AlkB
MPIIQSSDVLAHCRGSECTFVLSCCMRQGELFAVEKRREESRIDIPGFRLQLNYVTAEEESELLARIEEGPWETDWRRQIQQYGLGYAGEPGTKATWLRDFPEWPTPLARRVAKDAHLDRFPENCVINEYIPPLGIGPHQDYGAFGVRSPA